MDLKRGIVLVVIIVAVIWVALIIKKGYIRMSESHTAEHVEAAGNGGLIQYLRAPHTFSVNQFAASAVSQDCENYINGISSLNLAGSVTYQQLHEPPEGCLLTEGLVAETEKNYLKGCLLSNPSGKDGINDECIHSLLALRSSVAEVLLKSDKISEIESLVELTELLYLEVLKPTLNVDDPKPFNLVRAQEITDRMLSIDSKYRGALEVHILLRSLSAIESRSKQTLKEQDEVWAQIESDFQRLKTEFLQNPYARMSAMIYTRGYEVQRTFDYAEKLLLANPNDPEGVFLSAYAHWRDGDQETAFQELKKARDAAPENKAFQEAYSRLTEPGASDKAFKPGLKLELTLQDFDK